MKTRADRSLLVFVVREVTSPTTDVTARISAWLYLKFRT
jgi:hypothetical protein